MQQAARAMLRTGALFRSVMSFHPEKNFIIVGVTLDGQRFRPSDWAERLCGVMSVFGAERRMAYSPYVQPGEYEGHKCVFVDAALKTSEPMAYTFMTNFAKDNRLKVVSE
jgi:hypothetical protein